METSKANGVGCSYQRSEARGGTHFTLKPSVGNSGVLAVRGCKQASYVEGIT